MFYYAWFVLELEMKSTGRALVYSSTINRNIKTIRFLLPTKENRKTNSAEFFRRRREGHGSSLKQLHVCSQQPPKIQIKIRNKNVNKTNTWFANRWSLSNKLVKLADTPTTYSGLKRCDQSLMRNKKTDSILDGEVTKKWRNSPIGQTHSWLNYFLFVKKAASQHKSVKTCSSSLVLAHSSEILEVSASWTCWRDRVARHLRMKCARKHLSSVATNKHTLDVTTPPLDARRCDTDVTRATPAVRSDDVTGFTTSHSTQEL